MNTSDPLLLQTLSTYEQPKLKSMPLREQPAYRVAQNATACNLTELMAAVIGGQKQIEIAQALLAHFDGDIRRLYQAHPAELAKVKGINQATAIRIKAALNLGLAAEPAHRGTSHDQLPRRCRRARAIRNGLAGKGTPAHAAAGQAQPCAGNRRDLSRLGEFLAGARGRSLSGSSGAHGIRHCCLP